MKYALMFALLLTTTLMTGTDEDAEKGTMQIIAVNGTTATVSSHSPDREYSLTLECTLQNAGTVGHSAIVKMVEGHEGEGKYNCWDTGKQYKEPAPEDKQ
jgi:hypothetical protein